MRSFSVQYNMSSAIQNKTPFAMHLKLKFICDPFLKRIAML